MTDEDLAKRIFAEHIEALHSAVAGFARAYKRAHKNYGEGVAPLNIAWGQARSALIAWIETGRLEIKW